MARYEEVAARYRRRGFDCACGNVRMAARAVTRVYDRFFEPLGIGANQVALMWAVMALEPATARRIADATSAEETTVLRNLRVLERDGFIERATSEDRRERRVRLSVKGQKIMVRALPQWEKAQQYLAEVLGQETFDRATGDLLKLAAVG